MLPSLAMGYTLTLVGCISVYLSSPHQLWLAAPLPPGYSRWLGVVLLGAGLWSLIGVYQPVVAVFSQLMLVMTFFVTFPYLGVMARPSRGKP